MGFYVHIHVCFSCDENEGVAALASKHLPAVSDCREALWFLEDLSKRTGSNFGTKGGLSLWGMVGNYTDGDEFVRVLTPFWKDLLLEVPGGPLNFEHILVFVEQEQSGQAEAFEILLEGKSIVVRNYECPFTWAQM